MDVDTPELWCAIELDTVESVPYITILYSLFSILYSSNLVVEGEDEVVGLRAVCQLEVCAEGVDVCATLGPVESVALSHEQDVMVVGIEGEGLVCALEADVAADKVVGGAGIPPITCTL